MNVRPFIVFLFFFGTYLILPCIIFAQKPSAKSLVVVSGYIENFPGELKFEDISSFGIAMPNDHFKTVFIDSNKQFYNSFELNNPQYFRLGRNILYLSPDDTLHIFIDYKNPAKATFKGKHSEENNYLRFTPFPKGGSFINSGDSIKSTLSETLHSILMQAKKRETHLLSKSKMLDSKFITLESGRIDADVLNSLLALKGYFPYINKLNKEDEAKFNSEYEKIILNYIKPYAKKLNRPEFIELTVYRNILEDIIRFNPSIRHATQVKDWYKANLILQYLKENDTIKKKNILDTVMKMKSSRWRQLLTAMSKQKYLHNGDKAVSFSMTDTENTPLLLKEFKDKIIYIDIWATWCAPCLKELPYFNLLKEKFITDSNLVFISLSIDNFQAWQNFISENTIFKKSFITKRDYLNDYKITELPRYILIDKNFITSSIYAPPPSSPSTAILLESISKKYK